MGRGSGREHQATKHILVESQLGYESRQSERKEPGPEVRSTCFFTFTTAKDAGGNHDRILSEEDDQSPFSIHFNGHLLNSSQSKPRNGSRCVNGPGRSIEAGGVYGLD